jgi:hypothetical protein
MNTPLLILVVLASALVCPAMMLYGRRLGTQMACCIIAPTSPDATAPELRVRQAELGAEIQRRSASRELDPETSTPAA